VRELARPGRVSLHKFDLADAFDEDTKHGAWCKDGVSTHGEAHSSHKYSNADTDTLHPPPRFYCRSLHARSAPYILCSRRRCHLVMRHSLTSDGLYRIRFLSGRLSFA